MIYGLDAFSLMYVADSKALGGETFANEDRAQSLEMKFVIKVRNCESSARTSCS